MTKICIDGFNLALPKGTGIATYGRNLVHNLNAIGHQTQALYGPSTPTSANNILNETALTDAPRPAEKLNRRRKINRLVNTYTSQYGRTVYPVQPSGEVIWANGRRPDVDNFWVAHNLFEIANRSFKVYGKFTPIKFHETENIKAPDIMHWTCPLPLNANGIPNLVTIHDLIPLRLPHTTLDDKKTFMNLCSKIAKTADHIAVVSETTRKDVIRILGVAEDRVTNTYQAVEIPQIFKEKPQDEIEKELGGIFNLKWKDYFLHFGAIEPKKNMGRVIEAYLSSGVKSPLILIGGNGWLEKGETALLEQVKRDGGPSASRIRQYDYMPFSLLITLIRGAKATLFPSLYEGFGLPVLESMALETAVVTSNQGSLPEVAGDAAITVDPYNVAELTKAIRTMDSDNDLRIHLQQAGLKQSAIFSMNAYQQRLSDMYQRIK